MSVNAEQQILTAGQNVKANQQQLRLNGVRKSFFLKNWQIQGMELSENWILARNQNHTHAGAEEKNSHEMNDMLY